MIDLEFIADLGKCLSLKLSHITFDRDDIWTLCWVHDSNKINGNNRVSRRVQSLRVLYFDRVESFKDFLVPSRRFLTSNFVCIFAHGILSDNITVFLGHDYQQNQVNKI